MNDMKLSTIEGGGVASACGFRAGGIHAGFRDDPQRLDMALVEADELCPAAGVFTQNVFCAAPVTVSREHLDGCGFGLARAVVVNSGIANAATGVVGLETARRSAALVADVVGCAAEDVLVASTGIIGQQLDSAPFETGVPALHHELAVSGDTNESGHRAACAIMTTDTVPKEAAVQYTSHDPNFAGCTFTVGGMAKGSGMIMPHMATMIAILTTDAPVPANLLHKALSHAVNVSFNKVTVDGDTSTNDTCILMASGKAAQGATAHKAAPGAAVQVKVQPGKATQGALVQGEEAQGKAALAAPGGADGVFKANSIAYAEFEAALCEVAQRLARAMARDGEGATKLVTVKITGAASDEDADKAARTVANSPLVKTAIYGHDANWGRIAGALGRSGARFEQEQVDIDIMGMPVLRKGLPVPFDEEEALRRFEASEIVLEANLGAGSAQTTMWTCDFSHEYVSINGDYRS